MPDAAPMPVDVAKSVVTSQVKAQLRIGLAALAGMMVGKHLLPASMNNDAMLDAICALIFGGIAAGWQWGRTVIEHCRWWQLAVDPRVPNDLVRPKPSTNPSAAVPIDPAPVVPASPQEHPMSIGSTLEKVLGFIAGILIPGASADTTSLIHSIQQDVADWAGAAAKDLAAKLSVDPTMTGAEKIFAVTTALVQTAISKGIKADEDVLFSVLLDVAQAAYRATVPTIAADIVALASTLTANPLVGTIAELVGDEVQKLVTQWGGPSPSSTGIATDGTDTTVAQAA